MFGRLPSTLSMRPRPTDRLPPLGPTQIAVYLHLVSLARPALSSAVVPSSDKHQRQLIPPSGIQHVCSRVDAKETRESGNQGGLGQQLGKPLSNYAPCPCGTHQVFIGGCLLSSPESPKYVWTFPHLSLKHFCIALKTVKWFRCAFSKACPNCSLGGT